MAFYNADDLSESLKRVWRIERAIKYARIRIIRAIPELSRYERDPEWLITTTPKQSLRVTGFRARCIGDAVVDMCIGAEKRDAWAKDVQEAISGVSKRWYYVVNSDHFTCAICNERHITREAATTLREIGEFILKSMQTKTTTTTTQPAGAEAGAGLSE